MIKVSKLEFAYRQSLKKAINGIDFNINDGEIFGFLGPSGAGKTTTQRIIVGLLRNYSGSVEVMGLERRKWGRLPAADLFGLPWLSVIGALTPFYWVVRLINTPFNIASLIIAAMVHLVWLIIMFRILRRI